MYVLIETKPEATLYLSRHRAILPQVYHNRRNNEFVANSLLADDLNLLLPVKEEHDDLTLPMEQQELNLLMQTAETEVGGLNVSVKEEPVDLPLLDDFVLPLPVKEEVFPMPVKEEVSQYDGKLKTKKRKIKIIIHPSNMLKLSPSLLGSH